MRDIKFRAWDKTINYMDYRVRFSHFEDGIEVLDSWSSWRELKKDEYELMQYTGRKDSDGVEIYEGDILQSEHYLRYQVVFKGDCWRCEPLKRNVFKNRFIGRDLKVIGNIYENPELLEDLKNG